MQVSARLAVAEATSLDAAPSGRAAFLRDCLDGLSCAPKALPSKWLYDERGSELYEAICAQPEYYPARTEEALLALAAPALAPTFAYGTTLIELGSGASRKTRLLLDAAQGIATYVPIDISESELARSAAAIRGDYLGLTVRPLAGDFTDPDMMDFAGCERPLLLFFPGSTLGNFAPREATALLAALGRAAGPGARLLLGVDLAKDVDTLVRAYDDAAGVTAAFNRNLLDRIAGELGAELDSRGFAHRAVWNAAEQRIEMHLVARGRQAIRLAGQTFVLEPDETIHTENAYKLSREQWVALFAGAGWSVAESWRGDAPGFLVVLLSSG